MKENSDKCLAWVLKSEGGYVDHPKDPGGATNQGITQRTYNSYRRLNKKAEKNVKDITDEEVKEIYQKYYMKFIYFDFLPAGIDYAVFDFAVNSGPYRAIKTAQKVVKVNQDGIMGPITLKAIKEFGPRKFIDIYLFNRLAFVKKLKNFKYFGKGWTNRINQVKKNALNEID